MFLVLVWFCHDLGCLPILTQFISTLQNCHDWGCSQYVNIIWNCHDSGLFFLHLSSHLSCFANIFNNRFRQFYDVCDWLLFSSPRDSFPNFIVILSYYQILSDPSQLMKLLFFWKPSWHPCCFQYPEIRVPPVLPKFTFQLNLGHAPQDGWVTHWWAPLSHLLDVVI